MNHPTADQDKGFLWLLWLANWIGLPIVMLILLSGREDPSQNTSIVPLVVMGVFGAVLARQMARTKPPSSSRPVVRWDLAFLYFFGGVILLPVWYFAACAIALGQVY